MLGKGCDRCVEKSPLAVMVRGLLERGLGAAQLDAWDARTGEQQSTRTRLFSTVSNRRSPVVCCLPPARQAASRHHEATVGTAVVAVYNRLYRKQFSAIEI